MCKRIMFLFIMALFLMPFGVSAQGLSVSNISVANQSVNIDTSVTISITFNKQIKPFKVGFNFEDVFMIGPEKDIEISNIIISGSTVSADFKLKPNTTYQIILSNRFLVATD